MARLADLMAFALRGARAQAAVDDALNEMGAAPRGAAPTRNSEPPAPDTGGSDLGAPSDLTRGACPTDPGD